MNRRQRQRRVLRWRRRVSDGAAARVRCARFPRRFLGGTLTEEDELLDVRFQRGDVRRESFLGGCFGVERLGQSLA